MVHSWHAPKINRRSSRGGVLRQELLKGMGDLHYDRIGANRSNDGNYGHLHRKGDQAPEPVTEGFRDRGRCGAIQQSRQGERPRPLDR